MAPLRRLSTVLLSVALLVPVPLSPTSADVVNRPDLKATQGSADLVRGAERLKGQFTVRNVGSLPAVASTAYVQAKISGKWRYVTELKIAPLAPGGNGKYKFNSESP